ncbi:MAG: valine--tRNA ligase, partial [Acidimicrobiaceae bacterium]|nr:valine--tRNA ligase [Acidimicrobiaceae bacterium]
GRRLAVKLLNASKFVLRFDDPGDGDVTEALDRSMLHRLADLVDEATRALDAFDYARALERTESFFWSFTDDHLELVKARAYGEQGPDASVSARRALRTALGVLQQLFAPFMPFVAEEVWRWWHGDSVHASAWPESGPLRAAAGDAGALPGVVAAAVLGEVRRAKSEAKRPLRTEVLRAEVADTAERIAVLQQVAADVCAAGRIAGLVTAEGSELSVACELAPEAAA